MDLENKIKQGKLKESLKIIKIEFENLIELHDDICNELKNGIIIDKNYYEFENLNNIKKMTDDILDDMNTNLLPIINNNI